MASNSNNSANVGGFVVHGMTQQQADAVTSKEMPSIKTGSLGRVYGASGREKSIAALPSSGDNQITRSQTMAEYVNGIYDGSITEKNETTNNFLKEAEGYYNASLSSGDTDSASYWMNMVNGLQDARNSANNSRYDNIAKLATGAGARSEAIPGLIEAAQKYSENETDEARKAEWGNLANQLKDQHNFLNRQEYAQYAEQLQKLQEEGKTLQANRDNANRAANVSMAASSGNGDVIGTYKDAELQLKFNNAEQQRLSEAMAALDTQMESFNMTPEVQAAIERLKANGYTGKSGRKQHEADRQLVEQFYNGFGMNRKDYNTGDRARSTIAAGLETVGEGFSNLGAVMSRAVDYGMGVDGNVQGWENAGYATDELSAANLQRETNYEQNRSDYTNRWEKAGGNDTFFRYAAEDLEEVADSLHDRSASDLAAAKADLGKMGQFMVDAGHTIITIGADMALAPATGGSSLVPMFLRTFGSSAAEARRSGASFGKQIGYGALNASVETITEKMFGAFDKLGYGKGFLPMGGIEKALRDSVKSDAGKYLMTVLYNSVEEGMEEVFSDLAAPFGKWIIDEQSRGHYFSEIEISELFKDFLLGASLGGMGAVAGTGQTVSTIRSENTTNLAAISQKQARGETLTPEEQMRLANGNSTGGLSMRQAGDLRRGGTREEARNKRVEAKQQKATDKANRRQEKADNLRQNFEEQANGRQAQQTEEVEEPFNGKHLGEAQQPSGKHEAPERQGRHEGEFAENEAESGKHESQAPDYEAKHEAESKDGGKHTKEAVEEDQRNKDKYSGKHSRLGETKEAPSEDAGKADDRFAQDAFDSVNNARANSKAGLREEDTSEGRKRRKEELKAKTRAAETAVNFDTSKVDAVTSESAQGETRNKIKSRTNSLVRKLKKGETISAEEKLTRAEAREMVAEGRLTEEQAKKVTLSDAEAKAQGREKATEEESRRVDINRKAIEIRRKLARGEELSPSEKLSRKEAAQAVEAGLIGPNEISKYRRTAKEEAVYKALQEELENRPYQEPVKKKFWERDKKEKVDKRIEASNRAAELGYDDSPEPINKPKGDVKPAAKQSETPAEEQTETKKAAPEQPKQEEKPKTEKVKPKVQRASWEEHQKALYDAGNITAGEYYSRLQERGIITAEEASKKIAEAKSAATQAPDVNQEYLDDLLNDSPTAKWQKSKRFITAKIDKTIRKLSNGRDWVVKDRPGTRDPEFADYYAKKYGKDVRVISKSQLEEMRNATAEHPLYFTTPSMRKKGGMAVEESWRYDGVDLVRIQIDESGKIIGTPLVIHPNDFERQAKYINGFRMAKYNEGEAAANRFFAEAGEAPANQNQEGANVNGTGEADSGYGNAGRVLGQTGTVQQTQVGKSSEYEEPPFREDATEGDRKEHKLVNKIFEKNNNKPYPRSKWGEGLKHLEKWAQSNGAAFLTAYNGTKSTGGERGLSTQFNGAGIFAAYKWARGIGKTVVHETIHDSISRLFRTKGINSPASDIYNAMIAKGGACQHSTELIEDGLLNSYVNYYLKFKLDLNKYPSAGTVAERKAWIKDALDKLDADAADNGAQSSYDYFMSRLHEEVVCELASGDSYWIKNRIEKKNIGEAVKAAREQLISSKVFKDNAFDGIDDLIKAADDEMGMAAAREEISQMSSEETAEFEKNAKPVSEFDPSDGTRLYALDDPSENERDLVAIRNMPIKNAIRVLREGLEAMPSIAISKITHGHSKFGVVSFIYGKRTIDPEAYKENRVYSDDPWTAEHPRIEVGPNGERGYLKPGAKNVEGLDFWETHVPPTAENALEIMKSMPEFGEGTGPFDRVRFRLLTSFKSIQEIKDSEHLLNDRPHSEDDESRYDLEDDFEYLLEHISSRYSKSIGDIEKILTTAAENGGTREAISNAFNEAGTKLDSKSLDAAEYIFDDMKALTVGFFEAKASRLIYNDEIVGAIVPRNVSNDPDLALLLDLLNENGIKTFEYDSADLTGEIRDEKADEERRSVLEKEFTPWFFALDNVEDAKPSTRKKMSKQGFREKTQTPKANVNAFAEAAYKFGKYDSATQEEVSRVADWRIEHGGFDAELDRLANSQNWDRTDFAECQRLVFQMTKDLYARMASDEGLVPRNGNYDPTWHERNEAKYQEERARIDGLLETYRIRKSDVAQKLQQNYKFNTADEIRMRAAHRFLNFTENGRVEYNGPNSASVRMYRVINNVLNKTEKAVADGNIDDVTKIVLDVSKIRGNENLFGDTGRKGEIDGLEFLKASGATAEDIAAFAYGNINQIIDDFTPVKALDAVNQFRVMNMLSNIKTALNNILNNFTNMGISSVSQNIGNVAAKQFEKATGKKVAIKDTSWKFDKGTIKAEQVAFVNAALMSYYGIQIENGRIELQSGANFRASGNWFERLGARYAFFVNTFVMNPDQMGKARVDRGIQKGIDEAFEGVEMTPEMQANKKELEGYKEHEKNRRLVQADNATTAMVQHFKDYLNKVKVGNDNIGYLRLGDFAMAFAKVPVNIVQQRIAATPYGALYHLLNGAKGYTQAKQMHQDVIEGKAGAKEMSAFDMASYSRDVGRAATTGGMLAIGALAAMTGALKDFGNDDDDDDEARIWRGKGFNGLSLNISAMLRPFDSEWRDGDWVVGAGFLEIFAAPLSIGALAWEAHKDGMSVAEASWYATKRSFTDVLDALADIPGMQAASQMYEAYTYSSGSEDDLSKAWTAVRQYLANSAASYVMPNLITQTATAMDNQMRNPYAADNGLQQSYRIFANKIPFLRRSLPVKTDMWGNTRTYGENKFLAFMNKVVLPGQINKFEANKYEKEIMRLSRDGYGGLLPSGVSPKKIEVGDNTYDLNSKQSLAFEAAYKERYKEDFETFMDSDLYKQLDDPQRQAALKMLRLDVIRQTKQEFLDASAISDEVTMDKWEGLESLEEKLQFVTAKQIASSAWDSEEGTVADYAMMDNFIQNQYDNLSQPVRDVLGNSLTHLDDMYNAYKEEQITSQQWQTCYDIYRQYNAKDEDGHALYKANIANSAQMWAEMQRESGLSDHQMSYIEDNMQMHTIISPNDDQYKEYLNDAGMTREETARTIKAMSELAFTDGYASVQNSQKYHVIAQTVPKEKQWAAFWSIVPGNASKANVAKMRKAQESGMSFEDALKSNPMGYIYTKTTDSRGKTKKTRIN